MKVNYRADLATVRDVEPNNGNHMADKPKYWRPGSLDNVKIRLLPPEDPFDMLERLGRIYGPNPKKLTCQICEAQREKKCKAD